MKVKFCGLSSPDEVAHALRVGATHVGFVVQAPESHRNLSLEAARRLAEQAPGRLERVLVTPTGAIEDVQAALERVPADVVQATGEIPPDELEAVTQQAGVETWRAVGLDEGIGPALEQIEELTGIDAIVLDALSEGYGGHGETIDWSLAAELVASVDEDVVLAGGLTPDNVAEAIQAVDPWAVDVSSGIETEGRKDPDKMRAFSQAVQGEIDR